VLDGCVRALSGTGVRDNTYNALKTWFGCRVDRGVDRCHTVVTSVGICSMHVALNIHTDNIQIHCRNAHVYKHVSKQWLSSNYTRLVTSRHDTIRHVESMHFGCVELVEHARHVERVESCRDVT